MQVRLNPLFRRVPWERIRTAARELAPYLKPLRRDLLIAVVCSQGAVLMVIARPWPIKMVFDYALMPAGRIKWVFPYALIKGYGAMGVVTISCGLLLVITLLWGLFTYSQRFLVAAAGQQITFRMRRRMFAQLQRLSLSYHHKHQVGDLLLRATGDVNMLREMVVDASITIFSQFLVLFAMVGVMLYMDWQLTLVALAVLPLLGVAVFRISDQLRTAVRRQRKKAGHMASQIGEMLHALPVIQAFSREQYEDERFGESNRQNLKQGLRTVRLEANLERVAEMVIATGTAAVLWLGVKRVLDGILTPGDLIVFTHYLSGMYRPLRRISRVTGRLSKASVCADRVFTVLRADERIKVRRDANKAPRFRGRVTFKNVHFAYLPGVPVLEDISFTMTPGKTIAIVGPNGAGKSTLCSLLPRLYDPTSGTITIDGEKISHVTLDSLREQIGIVLQLPTLFAGTVRENIAYGKPEATAEEIEAAAKLADAHVFIERLPAGYDTAVGERGDTLSGGQRQKIAIARAMIKNPAILILDEPTAALDATSAAQVNVTLSRIATACTTFRVGHRLSELRHSDLCIVLQDGRIAQRGTHDDLLREPGWYRDIFLLQSRAGLGDGEEQAAGGRRAGAAGRILD